jgi:hypothetical protein
MPLRSASFCALLLLAGCATPAEPPAPRAQAVPPAGVPGIILAMRPVPAEPPEPTRILLSSFGGQAAQANNDVYEFIVRTANGTTISVVQPRTNGLHPGAQVSILRGAETRIDAPASD